MPNRRSAKLQPAIRVDHLEGEGLARGRDGWRGQGCEGVGREGGGVRREREGGVGRYLLAQALAPESLEAAFVAKAISALRPSALDVVAADHLVRHGRL